MRGKKGRTNVCSREGACEKDEGGRGEDRSLQLRGRMQEGRGRRRGGQMSAVEGACEKDEGGLTSELSPAVSCVSHERRACEQ